MQNLELTTVVGHILRYALEGKYIEVSPKTTIFYLNFIQQEHLVTYTWIKCLWDFTSTYETSITKNNPEVNPTN